jgi:hypothetical protein
MGLGLSSHDIHPKTQKDRKMLREICALEMITNEVVGPRHRAFWVYVPMEAN